MKEYRVLRELEPTQPTWAGESTRDRLEKNLNELARSGWEVRSFEARHTPAGFALGYRPTNLAYFVLLEREVSGSPPG